MKIVFLVGSYVPHQVLSIQAIIDNYDAKIHAISVSKNFTFIPPDTTNFSTNKLEDFTKEELLKKIVDIKPDMLVVAGWMVSEYVYVAKKIKSFLNIPVVAMSDTPWYGTFRQKINTIISPFHLKKAFTHLWVAGIYQYDYARKLGFENNQIIFNNLSGNTKLFNSISLNKKEINYPKNFIYIGRYTEIKGLRNLVQAWSEIEDKNGWTFTLVGDGILKEELMQNGNFIVKDYMGQDLLINEFENAGVFVLPSLREPWALVIHEAAAAGLPIICTKTCGAAPHFVIDGFNGYKVNNNSIKDLKQKLEKIMELDDSELISYSKNSRLLSDQITPDIAAASLMQLINEK